MLTITPITNVKNTINRNISFKAGVQSNYGSDAINTTADVKHEGGLLTDFLGTIKQSPLFYETFYKRQQSIEKSLSETSAKINTIA